MASPQRCVHASAAGASGQAGDESRCVGVSCEAVDRRWPTYRDCPGCWKASVVNGEVVNEEKSCGVHHVDAHSLQISGMKKLLKDDLDSAFDLERTFGFLLSRLDATRGLWRQRQLCWSGECEEPLGKQNLDRCSHSEARSIRGASVSSRCHPHAGSSGSCSFTRVRYFHAVSMAQPNHADGSLVRHRCRVTWCLVRGEMTWG